MNKESRNQHHTYSLWFPGLILGTGIGVSLFYYQMIIDHWALLSSTPYVHFFVSVITGILIGRYIRLPARQWAISCVICVALSAVCIVIPPHVARNDILDDYEDVPKPELADLLVEYVADDSWYKKGVYGSEMSTEQLAEYYSSILKEHGFNDSQYSNLLRCKQALFEFGDCKIQYSGAPFSYRKSLKVYVGNSLEDIWIFKYFPEHVQKTLSQQPAYESYVVIYLSRGSKM